MGIYKLIKRFFEYHKIFPKNIELTETDILINKIRLKSESIKIINERLSEKPSEKNSQKHLHKIIEN